MQQIVSITDARNNFSKLVQQVATSLQPVVIVRESEPEAILMPYTKVLQEQQEKDQLWDLRWKEFLKEGKKAGRRFLKERGLKRSALTEEQLYDLIDKI